MPIAPKASRAGLPVRNADRRSAPRPVQSVAKAIDGSATVIIAAINQVLHDQAARTAG